MPQPQRAVNPDGEDFPGLHLTDEYTPEDDEPDPYAIYEDGADWTKAEAEASIKRIQAAKSNTKDAKTKHDNARKTAVSVCMCELLNLDDHKGYAALGYASMSACIEARFKQSEGYCSRLLKAARFHRKVFGASEPMGTVKEGVIRPLALLPEDQWADAWEEAQDIADNRVFTGKAADFHTGQIRSTITNQVAARRKGNGAGVAKNIFGNTAAAEKQPVFRSNKTLGTSKNSPFSQTAATSGNEDKPPVAVAVNNIGFNLECTVMEIKLKMPDGSPLVTHIPICDRQLIMLAGHILKASADPEYLPNLQADHAQRRRAEAA